MYVDDPLNCPKTVFVAPSVEIVFADKMLLPAVTGVGERILVPAVSLKRLNVSLDAIWNFTLGVQETVGKFVVFGNATTDRDVTGLTAYVKVTTLDDW
jgi:hypothetical protein